MNSDEFNRIDQAVFGYFNGHRQLASSISLSSLDSYELAAASDLAPGSQLDPDQSYLTGLTLPDSKKYALIRTWLAPEMARPGCVWSHVLILGRDVLSTQADLTVLNRMFRRPADYQQDESLSIRIPVSRRAKGPSARKDVIEQVLAACYSKSLLSPTSISDEDREHAILAVWSQQWPRLRGTFSFRSIPSTADFKGQSFHFQTNTSPLVKIEAKRWIEEAAQDAVSGTVTPLRRFLWRYGKDVDTNRRTFPYLVNVYIETRTGRLNLHVANTTFEYFNAGHGDTLKRDMLGLSQSKLSLVPRLSNVDLIELIAGRQLKSLGGPTGDEITSLLARSDPRELPQIIYTIGTFAEKLGPLFSQLQNALVPQATEESLVDPKMPLWFVSEALLHRADLVSIETCSRLPSDQLTKLAQLGLPRKKLELVLDLLIGREFSSDVRPVLYAYPEYSFGRALDLYQHAELHTSWIDVFRSSPADFIQYVAKIDNGETLASSADLLGYPIDGNVDVGLWHSRLRSAGLTASSQSQSTMLVYVFVLCVRNGIENTKRILRDLLPELRSRILEGSLPAHAKRMLDRSLPDHSEGWDLNRRLLKLFRQGYKRGQNFDNVLDVLNLNDAEYAYATNQDPENFVRNMFRVFLPWVPWD
ncbi:hypothetical protein [Mesorhizobium sp. M1B.F.Ca.ET.045.04.1.1]|uniref:GAP1-N1 domain-containing protein n=1 Tax=Mesorhizobium sp. M1B.F.Ca.ET.045.04.1.1 TaxID=2493673 RepID=UPI000F74E8E2|nr:hypothetical protein [Mesorhizobium sp. M1B.F.Ca.ET.045.04.1.1]AZO30810.1 hypothetical protein EJ071_27715 [Mesorhizobium sp. M1B.F.Ca.ET.045.04.1.1]